VQLVIGKIGRAHGVQGDVGVEVRTDDPDRRFAAGTTIATDPPERGPLKVVTSRWHSGRLLVRFADSDDRTQAEALRGTILVIDIDDDERTDDPDEFYDHHLIGLRALTSAGEEVGAVTDVLHLPGQDVLAIKRTDGVEVLVPFVAELVPGVDLDARTVTIEPRPGLLDPDAAEVAAGNDSEPAAAGNDSEPS
jgi:16S rRNA processing protein RimM